VTRAGIYNRRPVRDVAFARKPSPLFLRAVAFAIPRPLAKVLPQRAACFAVRSDATVDRLVADLEQIEELEPPADLFGAEPVAQQRLDELPLDSTELAVPA
jgi:hypothetical protein